jgi:hypothetical protein
MLISLRSFPNASLLVELTEQEASFLRVAISDQLKNYEKILEQDISVKGEDEENNKLINDTEQIISMYGSILRKLMV